nr:MAG TPA: hypothetical protein [Caudoviricetes sp.]
MTADPGVSASGGKEKMETGVPCSNIKGWFI